ncbi:MAG: glycosyltransferase family 4 protein [Thermoanaerobaculia bacterium]
MRARVPARIGRPLRRLRSAWREARVAWRRRRLAAAAGRGADGAPRVLALASWTFPVYSQSFVHQELACLAAAGFDVRLVFARRGRPSELAPAHRALARRALRLPYDPGVHRLDLEHFERREPATLATALAELSEATGLGVARLLDHRDVLRGLSVARLAEAFRADYLHSYFFYEGALAAWLAARLLDLPRGFTAYADHRLDDYELKAAALQISTAQLPVATSRGVAAELRALAPGCAPRILVKPNAIDTLRFPARPGAAADSARSAPLAIACVCRIDPKKGLEVLAEALPRLGVLGIDAIVRHAGAADPGSAVETAAEDRLRARLAALGIAARFRREGVLGADGVARLLAECPLFVAPYVETSEGDRDAVPTALLEAMSTGAAVVASDAGSIAEVVTPEVDGLLVPQRDPAALAAAIARLARDPALAARLGAAAAATVRRRFDVALCEGALHERVRGLVERHRRRGGARRSA